jgi:hypothetical protein
MAVSGADILSPKAFSFADRASSKMPKVEDEPSWIREFKECASVYQIPDKTDPEEISSDGEFNHKVDVLDESCTEVYLI